MNAPARTCNRINRTASHQLREDSISNLGDSSEDSRRPLGSPLNPRQTDWLGTTQSNNSGTEILILTFGDPLGTSSTGPGAHGHTPSGFTEPLTSKAGVSWIRAAMPEMNQGPRSRQNVSRRGDQIA